MIDASQMIPLLLHACPSISDKWQEHLEYWDGAEAGLYNDVAVFAHHIVELYKQGKTDEFPAIFNQIEQFILNGTEEIKSYAIIGFLEDVQNIASHESFGYDVFVDWLPPASKQAWDELIAYWAGKESLADLVRWEIQQKQKKE